MPPVDISPLDGMDDLYDEDPYNFEIYSDINSRVNLENNLFIQLYTPYKYSTFEEDLEFYYFGIIIYYYGYDEYEADEILHNLSYTITTPNLIGMRVNLAQLCLLRDMDYELEILLRDHGFASTDPLKYRLFETREKMRQLDMEISNETKNLLNRYNVLNILYDSSSTLSNDSVLSDISNGGGRKKRSSGRRKKRSSGRRKKRSSGRRKRSGNKNKNKNKN